MPWSTFRALLKTVRHKTGRKWISCVSHVDFIPSLDAEDMEGRPPTSTCIHDGLQPARKQAFRISSKSKICLYNKTTPNI